jgi:hypothetical protein
MACQAEGRTDVRDPRVNTDIILDLKQVGNIEFSAAKMLNVQEKDTLWETQVAIILDLLEHATDAEKRCRQALDN